MTLPGAFSRYRREVEETLRELLGRGSPSLLYRMMRYHLGWEDAQGRPITENGGKALRPTLCLLACEAVGGDWRKALPVAAAVELVHNFSLVHDDIQDQDRERRHRPTVWSVWGQPQAINAGDSLLALGRLAILRLGREDVPPAKVISAARILDECTLEMVEGQSLDLSFEETLEVSLDAYMEMIARKTGALFDCALRLGALVGSDEEATVDALGRCGRLLGVAFQVRDDMLGVWGVGERTGKPLVADIRRRKKSLPVVYALSASAEERNSIARIYQNDAISDEDVGAVCQALEALGAPEYCRQVAHRKKGEALAALEGLGLDPERHRELKEIADFLLEREF
ncbi:MAG: polyprenyl synthetase family protein [Chloroflexi bacterium]|nr:polyprenyl synthetase family protein [Chloroflexota bacterium]